jgi:DsbC/DsbD-like thiol-disulfide interchange protein
MRKLPRRSWRAQQYISPSMHTSNFLTVTTLLIAAGCADNRAPVAKGPQPVQWSAEVASQTPGTDGTTLVNVRLKAVIQDGWHVYSLTQKSGGPTPLTVKVDSSSALSIGSEVQGPAPQKAMDPNFGVETETYSGAPVITVPVRVSSKALASGKPIEVKVRSQACSDKFCLPAKTATVTVALPAGKS